MSNCDDCRRRFLRAGVAGVATLLLPACGGSQAQDPPGGDPPDGGDGVPGDGGAGEGGDGAGGCEATCPTAGETLRLSFTDHPQLANVGGSVVANAPNYTDPLCGLHVVIVAQPAAGQYVAFSASCTHACCTVNYNAGKKQFDCHCHGSVFSTAGAVVNGPANQPLPKLAVCADACGVTVTLG
jgi:Rieske Fe-S protein